MATRLSVRIGQASRRARRGSPHMQRNSIPRNRSSTSSIPIRRTHATAPGPGGTMMERPRGCSRRSATRLRFPGTLTTRSQMNGPSGRARSPPLARARSPTRRLTTTSARMHIAAETTMAFARSVGMKCLRCRHPTASRACSSRSATITSASSAMSSSGMRT